VARHLDHLLPKPLKLSRGHHAAMPYEPFRRSWASCASEITETALAHVIGDKAEQAYRRSGALEKRRKLMEAWRKRPAAQGGQKPVAKGNGRLLPCPSQVHSLWLANALGRNPFTLFNGDTAAGCTAFSAFFHGAHTAFSLRANAKAHTADYHTDTRRRRALLNDRAPLRGRFLNDVIVRKARRNHEGCQGGTNKNCAHWEGLLQL
jgi:hypothetical protein